MNRLMPCLFLIGSLAASSALAQSTATINYIGTISEPTSCSLTTRDITLPIGPVDRSEFGSPGSSSGWSPNEALISAGCNATQVSMTFFGTADANDPSLFQVQGGATGVGIQLARTNNPNMVAIPNDTTRPITFPAAAAGEGYSFAARYVRTTAELTTGRADAAITVTITYI